MTLLPVSKAHGIYNWELSGNASAPVEPLCAVQKKAFPDIPLNKLRRSPATIPRKITQEFLTNPDPYTRNLDIPGFVKHSLIMQGIKISSIVDDDAWNELKALATETHQSLSGVLTEEIREYVSRKRVRPEVLIHLDQSITENEELGKLHAK